MFLASPLSAAIQIGVTIMKALYAVRPVLSIIPEVASPERKVIID